MTISSLLHKLSPWLPTLDAVWEIFTAGIEADGKLPDANADIGNSGRVSRLLTALYDGVVMQDNLGQCSTHMVSCALQRNLTINIPVSYTHLTLPTMPDV